MNSSLSKLTKLSAISVSLLMFAFFVAAVSAQETRGTIRGTVSDPNKAAVPGAVVKIVDTARGTTTNTTTNEDGYYQANYLIPSNYQIVVEASGFKRVLRENVALSIGQTLNIDIPLEIGGNQETVTVTSETPPLETSTGSLGLTVDQQRISELPLVHGDPYTLIGLAPGTTFTGSARLDRPFEPTHIVGYAIDGTRGNRSDLTIDGVSSTSTANANEVIASYVPPTDIVQEFKVQTATFDAQFGNTEGGVTSISIKSGTNSIDGSLYYFAEPGSWAANDFFGNSRGNPRPSTKSDRYGGYLSGPVRLPWLYNGKDKTFFLFGFEAIRDSRPRFDATNIFVPTEAIRNGDFRGQGVTIYDPLTSIAGNGTNGCPAGQFCRTAFANNVIPADRINPVARKVLEFYALPKGPGTSGLFGNINDSTLAEVTDPYNNWTFRVDQNISNNNRLFVRGSWYDRSSIYNDYLASEATGVNFRFNSRQGVIDDVHTFNSSTILNVRYGYNRFIRDQDQELDARSFDLTRLGFSSNYNDLVPESMRRFPRFDFTGGMLGTGYGNEFRPTTTHTVAAILNKTFDTHAVKFGAELRVYREDSNFNSNDQTGQFSFNNTYTRPTSATTSDPTGLQAVAAFLLGLPSTQSIVRRADYSEYSKTYGFFVHDDWKVNNKLTVNMGLRYEVETPLVERNNKSVSGFDFGYVQPIQSTVRARLAASPITGIDPNINLAGGLLFAGQNGQEQGLYETPKNSFLPRFGVAYQLDEKTVIRGGFGLFAGFLGQRRGDVIQPGFTRTSTLPLVTLASGEQIPNYIQNFPTIQIFEPVGDAQGLQTGIGGGISFFNQNPKVSKQARWQVGVQRELWGGFVAEATYVGNYGYDIEIARNINALPARYLNSDNFLSAAQTANNNFLNQTAGNVNPFRNLPEFAGTGLFSATTISRSQLLRPFPQFGDITTSVNDGKSWYHSGQFSLQKRFSQGYTIQASYTWSKWIQATEYLNAGDDAPTKMLSDQDVPHKFSLSGIYALPFGKGKQFLSNANGIVDRIVNGWQVQGVYNFQVGFPINFTTDLFYNGGDISIDPTERTTAAWFNTSVFSRTAPLSHLRTLPFRFTDVRRDNINNVDLSVIKDTRIREGMKVQLRFELINAFNEPYFPAPVINPTASNFGQINASTANQDNYARRAQIGIKFLF
jgi:hypothetical protein